MSNVNLNIVVVGREGQLAWELERCLASLGRVTALGRPQVDLLHPRSAARMIHELKPEVIVNAAAYTSVDPAETEPEVAKAVNAEAPGMLAEEARSINALFIHYSTDYVYDGAKKSPYTESDPAHPINVYGKSKLAGDRAVQSVGGSYLILRTSWVYGSRGRNFLRTILKLAVEREELRIVADQIGAPTWSHDVANATGQIIGGLASTSDGLALGERRGIYNITARGAVSWCGFARAIVEGMGRSGIDRAALARIVPITTEEYHATAARPRNSVLSNDKIREAFGVVLPDWKLSLEKVLSAMEPIAAARIGPGEYS